jgi:hypothetical protein
MSCVKMIFNWEGYEEAIQTLSKAVSSYFRGETKDNHEKPQESRSPDRE